MLIFNTSYVYTIITQPTLFFYTNSKKIFLKWQQQQQKFKKQNKKRYGRTCSNLRDLDKRKKSSLSPTQLPHSLLYKILHC